MSKEAGAVLVVFAACLLMFAALFYYDSLFVISRDEAVQIARERSGVSNLVLIDTRKLGWWRKDGAGLKWGVPMWEVHLQTPSGLYWKYYYLDAKTGEVLNVYDNVIIE